MDATNNFLLTFDDALLEIAVTDRTFDGVSMNVEYCINMDYSDYLDTILQECSPTFTITFKYDPECALTIPSSISDGQPHYYYPSVDPFYEL